MLPCLLVACPPPSTVFVGLCILAHPSNLEHTLYSHIFRKVWLLIFLPFSPHFRNEVYVFMCQVYLYLKPLSRQYSWPSHTVCMMVSWRSLVRIIFTKFLDLPQSGCLLPLPNQLFFWGPLLHRRTGTVRTWFLSPKWGAPWFSGAIGWGDYLACRRLFCFFLSRLLCSWLRSPGQRAVAQKHSQLCSCTCFGMCLVDSLCSIHYFIVTAKKTKCTVFIHLKITRQ